MVKRLLSSFLILLLAIPAPLQATFFFSAGSAAAPAIAFSSLGNNSGSTTGATSYATTSTYTPTANALVLACVVNSKASAPDTPTFSGNGLTWVQVSTTTYNTAGTPTTRMTIFRALGGSPTTTAGTADFAGATQTGCIVRVVQFTNPDTSGTNGSGAIGQVNIVRADATTNPTALLGALTGSANAVAVFAAHDLNSTTYGAAEASWTEDGELAYNTPTTGLYTGYRLATTDNSVTVTGASADWCIAAIEVRVSGATGAAFDGTFRYVDTGSSAGGDGTSTGTGGGTRAFASLREAANAMPGTLLNPWKIMCSGTAADTLSVTQSNLDFITTTANYWWVKGNNTTGKYSTSHYRIEVTDSDIIYNNNLSDQWIEDLQAQITVTTSTGNDYTCYRAATANNTTTGNVNHKFVNCIAKVVVSGGATDNVFCFINSDPTTASGGTATGGTCRIINSIGYGGYCGSSSDGSAWGAANLYTYNCTFYGNEINVLDVQKCINTLATANTSAGDFLSTGTTGHSNNASGDGSAGGTGSRTSQTFTFVNAGAGDFHLQSGDAGAKDFGTSSVGGLYTTDIDGQTRTGSWDIGADEQQ